MNNIFTIAVVMFHTDTGSLTLQKKYFKAISLPGPPEIMYIFPILICNFYFSHARYKSDHMTEATICIS